MKLKLHSKFKPAGDQEKAIKELINGIKKHKEDQILLGATGTGKTFTIANVLAKTNSSAIVLSHNKTLAGQLYSELKSFFPENRVEYFISNFDYYRPEAYMPGSDTYIDKTSKSNWDIEAMRMSAINGLLSSEPVIVVASVAAIYGQMSPFEYEKTFVDMYVGKKIDRKDFLRKLAMMNYTRNAIDVKPGTFRSRGDVVEIAPITSIEYFYRVEMFDDNVEAIKKIDYLSKKVIKNYKSLTIPPANAYTTSKETIDKAVGTIKNELKDRLKYFKDNNRHLEYQRLEERVNHDIDSLSEFGIVSGIENYSMHLDGRKQGDKPNTIFDYLLHNANSRKQDPLIIIDESHMMVPQLNAMYNGDRSRKSNLVEYGFRLPSALDNRPLKFEEYENIHFQKIYVSATPASYELEKTNGEIIPQIVRPTGLLDPTIEIVKISGQIEDIYDKIQKQKEKNERTLILTTTKRMAEELSNYLLEKKEKIAYIHSDYKTFERDEIIRKLRLGVYDTIVGINLLREGIDIPEVSLVLIIDADKESFFRSFTSLIQIVGRAARNANGHVVFYADRITKSMRQTIDETNRRRDIQIAYNKKHNITPQTIVKEIPEPLDPDKKSAINKILESRFDPKSKWSAKAHKEEIKKEINKIKGRMFKASRELDFERAAQLRDTVLELESLIN